MSFNAVSSGIGVGQTELEQYNRYTEITEKRNDLAIYSKYICKIAITENRSTTDGIFIRIQEYFSKRSINGGSSSIISDDHIGTEQCRNRDFFQRHLYHLMPIYDSSRKTDDSRHDRVCQLRCV